MPSTSTAAAADPDLDPVTVLAMVVESLEATEASIARLQAVKEGFLAVAARAATEIASATDTAALPEPVKGISAEIAARSVAAEIGAALRVSDRTVQRRMAQATDLMTRFPAVLEPLSQARISLTHARMIQDAGSVIADDAARDAFVARVLPVAEGESPNRTKRIFDREAERAHPRDLTTRHRDAQENRRVWREDLPDGQKMLGLIHSATLIDGIYDRLSQQARAIQIANARAAKNDGPAEVEQPSGIGHPDDPRTIDQLRADLAADTLLTGAPAGHDTIDGPLSAISARVEITIPALTLANAVRAGGSCAPDSDPHTTRNDDAVTRSSAFFRDGPLTELPGELAGGSPIDTDTARILAAGAPGWERVLTHPVTGAVLAVDHYRPNTDLRRHLHARDARCRFPTCNLPPVAHDLDHTLDAALGGRTEEANLGACCRRHHITKHHGRWIVTQLDAGRLRWTSPTGRTYVDAPPCPVTFTIRDPDPDPDPPPQPDSPPAPF